MALFVDLVLWDSQEMESTAHRSPSIAPLVLWEPTELVMMLALPAPFAHNVQQEHSATLSMPLLVPAALLELTPPPLEPCHPLPASHVDVASTVLFLVPMDPAPVSIVWQANSAPSLELGMPVSVRTVCQASTVPSRVPPIPVFVEIAQLEHTAMSKEPAVRLLAPHALQVLTAQLWELLSFQLVWDVLQARTAL